MRMTRSLSESQLRLARRKTGNNALLFVFDVQRLARWRLRHEKRDVPLDGRRLVRVGMHDAWLNDHERILGKRVVVQPVLDRRLAIDRKIGLDEPVHVGAWT